MAASFSQSKKALAPIDSSRGRPKSAKPGGLSEPLTRLHDPPERKALDSFTQPENALAPIDSRTHHVLEADRHKATALNERVSADGRKGREAGKARWWRDWYIP